MGWIDNLGRKEISSFVGLIKAFHKHWDISYVEEEHNENTHSLHAICDKESLEGHTPPSSLEPPVFPDPRETRGYVEINLHQDIPSAIIMDSKDKGLVNNDPY